MALTEHEKKVLEQMEASLREEGPTLVFQVSAPAVEEDPELIRGPRTPHHITLGLTEAALGMTVLVVVVSLGYSIFPILLGVAGFVLTVAGVLYAMSRPGASSSEPADELSARGADKSSGWSFFIQGQECHQGDRRDSDWEFHTTDEAG